MDTNTLILQLLTLISEGRLISELQEQTSITTDGFYAMVNIGSDDAKKIKIPLLRGLSGDWDASTNTPNLFNGNGVGGTVYRVSVGGDLDLGNGTKSYGVDELIYYNGVKWVKLTQTQISDIEGLSDYVSNIANINGDFNENFQVADGVSQYDAVNKGQLDKKADSFGLGSSFYYDTDKVLRVNTSTFRETVFFETGDSHTFFMDFEPTFILGIYVNGIRLDESRYTYTSPNQIRVLNQLSKGDVLKFMYEHFVDDEMITEQLQE